MEKRRDEKTCRACVGHQSVATKLFLGRSCSFSKFLFGVAYGPQVRKQTNDLKFWRCCAEQCGNHIIVNASSLWRHGRHRRNGAVAAYGAVYSDKSSISKPHGRQADWGFAAVGGVTEMIFSVMLFLCPMNLPRSKACVFVCFCADRSRIYFPLMDRIHLPVSTNKIP